MWWQDYSSGKYLLLHSLLMWWLDYSFGKLLLLTKDVAGM